MIEIGKIEQAVEWAIQIANDNSHGYSQANRWGPDYDCSSFVITAYEQAGLKVKEAGASYTGNMRGAFIACGFVDVTTQVGLSSGYGIQAGDVLLNYSAHTCLAIGNGKVANCRTSEGNTQSGDQSGNEIRVQNYWNFPWNCVLRYKEKTIGMDNASSVSGLGKGAKGEEVKDIQEKLIALGYDLGPWKADGEFGAATMNAVIAFQKDRNLKPTGIVDDETKKALNHVEVIPDEKQKNEPESDSMTNEHAWQPKLLQMSNAYSTDCVVLQSLLNARHFACGSADGFFGAKTQAKVNEAQQWFGLPATGICDHNLWKKLLEII